MTPATIPIHNPASGEVIEQISVAGAADVAAAAERLRAAQPAWDGLGPAGRASVLRRLRDWMLDHDGELLDLYQRETSKPRQEAALELMAAVDIINYYADHAEEFLAPQRPKPHSLATRSKQLLLTPRPYPVAGIITPWNFPLGLVLLDMVPALTAGSAVLLKPSEVNPLAMRRLQSAWTHELGLPGVWETVVGQAETGEAVVDKADVVQFTGSSEVGRKVMERAARTLTPVGLELGGKDAMIVLADADLERAANGAAWGSLFNSGQVCVSVERIYVEAPVYDEFVARLADRVRSLRQGADDDRFRFDIGAMMTERGLQTVAAHVKDALALGARAIVGGPPAGDTGRFYPPTLLVDVDHSMECMREETFGPLASVMRVRDAEEAIGLANDSEYGLSASVWSRDRERALAIAARLEVGAVNVNDVFANLFTLPLPHGGWKASGIGARSGGRHGVMKYCRTQAVTISRLTPKREIGWFPYGPRSGRILGAVTHLLGAGDLRRKLGLRASNHPRTKEHQP